MKCTREIRTNHRQPFPQHPHQGKSPLLRLLRLLRLPLSVLLTESRRLTDVWRLVVAGSSAETSAEAAPDAPEAAAAAAAAAEVDFLKLRARKVSTSEKLRAVFLTKSGRWAAPLLPFPAASEMVVMESSSAPAVFVSVSPETLLRRIPLELVAPPVPVTPPEAAPVEPDDLSPPVFADFDDSTEVDSSKLTEARDFGGDSRKHPPLPVVSLTVGVDPHRWWCWCGCTGWWWW